MSRAWRIVFLLALAAAARADDSPPVWGKLTTQIGTFPMVQPFAGEFRFGWSNIEAARAKAVFVKKDPNMEVTVSGGTTGLARTLWQLSADARSVFRMAGLQPISFSQVEKYAKRTVVTKAEFRPDGLWRIRQVRPLGSKDERWKKVNVQPIRDMVAGMLFIRSQPLKDGDVVRTIIYPGDTPFLSEVTVLAHEQLKIAGRTLPAIKLDFRPQRIVKEQGKYVLRPHGKFTNGTVWISDDAHRIPLRCEVNIFIGYVFGELTNASFADGATLP